MEHELININANLVREPRFAEFEKNEKTVRVANFTLVRVNDGVKSYTDCSVFGEKSEVVEDFKKGDLIHVYGYFKENQKNDKTYTNFIVVSLNKIENEENQNEEE